MAASANPNPSGGNQDVVVSNGNNSNNHSNSNTNNNTNSNSNSNGGRKSDNSATVEALKHTPEPGLAIEWTPEETAIVDNALVKFASETPFRRYALIADLLNDKTLRDVALRCRWMTKKESGKRRKDDMTRRHKDKKEKTADPSAKPSTLIAMRPNVPPYAPPMLIPDNDDGIPYEAIGGSTGQLLAQNSKVFDQISANFANLRAHDNINLFRQTRDNILTIMNELNNDMPGIMKQMPLPAKLNDELVTAMLGGPSHPMQP